ncbi:hypothetical protein [Halorubrum sp. 2020YC2]|uniref:DUF7284 family protein n=1 Tax=Halorubrum sp. 2020YC2 TaxID=2836432 RepID=UPI002037421C|nr:hypothetical protein [Halorubrum sp. 2020YC2]
MTSTVLDVTLLLLCVSASVVALGASDAGGPGHQSASDAADRLVTETATVAYSDADAPNGTRRVHATRAELLALLAGRDADGAFARRATEAVRTGLGPRTRVDVTVAEAGGSTADGHGGPAEDDGSSDPITTATATNVDGFPAFQADDGSRPEWMEESPYPGPIADHAVPDWGVDERSSKSEATDPANPVAVGPEPPRNADVTAAVVGQPIPAEIGGDIGAAGSSGRSVRIIVRRW